MTVFRLVCIKLNCLRPVSGVFGLERNIFTTSGVISFLVEFYDVEHLQSIEDAVDDLIVCCQNNGGHLSCIG